MSAVTDIPPAPVRQRPPFLQALRFSEDEYARARSTGGVLELRLHVVRQCNLRCTYCFTHDLNTGPAPPRKALTYEETCDVICQAQEIGARTIHILGPGEPTLYDRLSDLVRFVRGRGLMPYFPTNTLLLTRNFASFLYDQGVNLLGKFNSLIPSIQDQLIGRSGVHHMLENKLRMLADLGFARAGRLAAHCVISRLNYAGIPEVFVYLRDRGILPFVDTLTMTGKGNPNMDVSAAERDDLFQRLARIDNERYGYHWDIHDGPHIGDDYRRYLHVCVVNLYGDVYPTDCLRVQLGLNVRSGALGDLVRSAAFRESRRTEKHLAGAPQGLLTDASSSINSA